MASITSSQKQGLSLFCRRLFFLIKEPYNKSLFCFFMVGKNPLKDVYKLPVLLEENIFMR